MPMAFKWLWLFLKVSPLRLIEAELAKVDNLHDQRQEADILKDLILPHS